MESVAAKTRPGQPVDQKALIAAMKDALGDVLDDTTMKALEVSQVKSGGAQELSTRQLGKPFIIYFSIRLRFMQRMIFWSYFQGISIKNQKKLCPLA